MGNWAPDPFKALPSVSPFRAAAAVLTSFDPATLRPAGEVEDPDQALGELLLDCEPAGAGGAPTCWTMEDSARRETLLRLAREPDGLHRALAANFGQRPEDPVQRALDELIEGRGASSSLEERPLEELLSLSRASDWLTGAIERLPPREQLLTLIDRERLLKPFRRLLARGFVGRGRELARLHAFLRDRNGGDILSLHGPGGVGKSTLLARFLMEVAAPESIGLKPLRRPYLFAYLDVDRTVLDPRDPTSFAKEAARQLNAQSSAAHDLGQAVQRGLVNVASRNETAQLESATDDQGEASALLIELTRVLAKEAGRPVLIVVDTWEEAQAAGISSEAGMARLLAMLAASPSLRIICSGRAPLRAPRDDAVDRRRPNGPMSLNVDSMPIESFDGSTAEAYLASTAQVPPEMIQPIIKAVGTNPLSLALAARVVQREGPKATADLAALVAKVKAEQLQGQLYTRLLGHIHDQDNELQRLAHPGLVVRRITPAIILHVLAGPCGVTVLTDRKAEELFLKLSGEPALAEADEDAAKIIVEGQPMAPLRYRSDLRRLALPDLRRTLPDQVAAIHAAAIAYFAQQEGPRARAEELYHRLAGGELPPTGRWEPGVERWLRASDLPELPPRARLWLLEHLGQPLDQETRAAANLERWEQDTAEQVRAHLARREWQPALALMRERAERGPGSPLLLLEAQALVQGAAFEEAEVLLRRGSSTAAQAGEPGLGFLLLLLLAEAQARRSDLLAALVTLNEAAPFGSVAPEAERLRWRVAQLRVRRELGRADLAESQIRAEAMALLDRTGMLQQLERRPALLREAVVELGQERPELVALAVRILGIGRIRLPPQLAPFRLPAWAPTAVIAAAAADMLAPLVQLLARFSLKGPLGWLLRMTVDLLRSVIAAGGPAGIAALALGDLATLLARELKDEATPAIVAWSVKTYRTELAAIGAEETELDGPPASVRQKWSRLPG